MTWKEYKQTRLTVAERSILANQLERVYRAAKDGKTPNSASQTEITLIHKLMEDEQQFLLSSIINALAALDEIDIKR